VLRYSWITSQARQWRRQQWGQHSLIDGQPAKFATLALSVQGKRIRTAESLGGARPMRYLAALSTDAQQCGFCTPGFVVATRAFLNKHPQATVQEIRRDSTAISVAVAPMPND
jgi:aerobic-type carbon monoxide dehydrogenase small subunit (CoxS/CutS family)